ncbi:hypothetical protein Dxin01_00145 [Deinococcus xinjiangensis]|uniref:Uncharacterized protein n=1 Tax=Deinococcus xinjiangensis TaxID=457454 RepID=A0ABP9V568_9DEIO
MTLSGSAPQAQGAGCAGTVGCALIIFLFGVVGFAMIGLMLKGLFN